MEESLSSKLKEFMTVLDQVKKYSALLTALPDFAIIIAHINNSRHIYKNF